MADETIWKLDIQPGSSPNTLKALENSLNTVKNCISQVAAAGENFDKLNSLQTKAAEAAKRLEVAQASAAVALKKAKDATDGGKASAEQIALAQSRAALAAQKIEVAENAAAGAMQKVKAEADRLAGAMQEDAEKTNIFARAAAGAKIALGHIGLGISTTISSASEFGSKFKNASGSLLDFGSKVGMTVIGIKGLAEGAVSLASSLFAPNASIEQMRVSFKAFIPDAKDLTSTLADLKKFSAVTPFEGPEVNKAALALLNMKVQAKDLTTWIGNIGAAVSKVGGDGLVLDDVAQIIQQMGVKGKVTTEEMMQLSERNIPAFQILADAMNVPVASLQDMISKGELGKDKIELLVQSMGKFGGSAMVEQGQTFNGLLSTFKDNIQQALASFTGPVFNKAKDALTNLGNLVSSPAFQQFATDMGTKVGGALTNVVDFVQTQAIPTFQRFSGYISQNIVPNFQNAATTFSNFVGHGQAAIPILAGLGAILAFVVAPAIWSVASGVIAATWPFLAIGLAVAGVTAIFLHFYNSNAGLRDFINNIGQSVTQLWTNISSNFIPAMQKIGSVIQTQVWPVLQGIGAFLVSTFKPVWDQLVSVWRTQLLPSLQQLWAALVPLYPLLQLIGILVGGTLLMIFASLMGVIRGLAQGVAAFVGGVATIISGFVQTITGLVQVIAGVIRIIIDIFTGNFRDLGPALGQIWQGILNILGGLWKGMVGAFQTVFGTIWGLVSGFVQGVIGFFVDLYNRLVGHSIIPDMVNGIVNWFAQLPGRVGTWVGNMYNMVVDWFSKLPGRIMDFMGTIKNNIGDAWNWIYNIVSGKVGGIFNNIIKPFNNARDAIGGVVKSFVNNAIGVLNNGIAGVESFVNLFGDAIDWIADKLGAGKPIPHHTFGRIPGYASGTDSHPGGPAIVGERGPELLMLPKGASVLPNDKTMALLAMMGGKVPGYASGIGDAAGDFFNWIAGGAKSLLDNALKMLNVGTPKLPGVLSDIGSHLFDTVKDWAGGFIDKLLPKFSAAGPGGTAVNIPGTLQSWIQQAMVIAGAPASWATDLGIIAMAESGGNPSAINLTDSNAIAGHPSQGIMQTIPSTFAAYALPGHLNILNPIDNIIAGIRYIMSRYGDVFHVPGIMSLAAGGAYQGYANGGMIREPIMGFGLHTGTRYAFGESGPEMVVPRPGFASSSGISSGGGNDQAIALLSRILDVLEKQGRGNTSTTLNANVASGSMNAQKINQLVQSLSGFDYEAIARGAF